MSPSARSPRRATRGVTLVEMMVTAAVLGIVLAAVLMALAENQRQYVAHADVAAIQSTLRAAAYQLEHALARAGYGIDPNYAVEPWELDAAGNEVAGGMRDGMGANGADHLVVQYRDPMYGRRVASASSTSLSIDPADPRGVVAADFERGQRLLVLCQAGADFAYVRAAGVSGTHTIDLLPAGQVPFADNAKLGAAGSCFNSGLAYVYRVERRHFFVGWLDEPGGARQRPCGASST